MADWSTVAIAGITGLAGIGGSAIGGLFASTALAKTHKRDDARLMREQIEALYEELDAIQQTSQRNTPKAMELASGSIPAEPLEGANLGKAAAIIALYFPDLNAPLLALRVRENAAVTALREGLQGDSPLAAGGIFAIEQSVYLSSFCNEMREVLVAKAHSVGASVRRSVE
ncbi:MAG TPA: hypothetical protein VL094_02875 [Sphingomonadaceae bacterium]|nr:hypothetical protein [Sphingomonadaceae bacterium]